VTDIFHSISDLRDRARATLPGPLFDFLDGGAETEMTLRRNTEAFDSQRLAARCLVDVAAVETSTTLLGKAVRWPLLCAPTGASRLFHPAGEIAVARAAAAEGVFYSLATGSTYSIEDVAAAASGPKIFQLYVYKNRDLTWDLMERARAAGYDALCITVDVPKMGKRERDLRSGFPSPFATMGSVASYARHPTWLLAQARRGPIQMANFQARGDLIREIDPALSWTEVREIIEHWQGPTAIKGIMRPDDARRALDAGATAIFVSNHGGRQLDGAASPFDVLPTIVSAVGARGEVVLDGGVRRGVHILKALALGAKACSIGRPYLYGLAAAGEAGARRALEILRSELVLAMQLSGCPNLSAIDSTLLQERR